MDTQTLRLSITNMESLPDGGPLEVTVAPGDILEVGRDSGIGWSLPDPRRFISSRHMEVRHENGGWWLYDISTNGTFVNGASARVKSPYRLHAGDLLQVGHYSIEVTFQTAPQHSPAPEPMTPASPAAPARPSADIWGAAAPSAPQPAPFPAAGSATRPSPVPSAPADIWGAGRGRDPAPSQPDHPETVSAQPVPGRGPGTTPPVEEPRADRQHQGPDAILEAIAAAAGLPEGSLGHGNPLETATEIGRALRTLGEELSSLLQARAVARRSVRSGQVTMIGREDNNPLKFMPTPDQALSAMFGPPRPGFQRGSEAIRAAFGDIKRHQYATHAAIQPALARLLEDLAPETIEARIKTSGILQNRRAKAWETFVERWDAKAQAHDNGMLDVFLAYFAEAYDRENGG